MSNKIKNIAYVDGSYNQKTHVYGGGGILFDQFGNKHIVMGCGTDPTRSKMRNVAGELLAVQMVVNQAKLLSMKKLTIFYDYIGIANWVLGDWRAKDPTTKAYVRFMWDTMHHGMNILFEHVKGHSGDAGNTAADLIAKAAVKLGSEHVRG